MRTLQNVCIVTPLPARPICSQVALSVQLQSDEAPIRMLWANRVRSITSAACNLELLREGVRGTDDPIRFTVPRRYLKDIDTRSERMDDPA